MIFRLSNSIVPLLIVTTAPQIAGGFKYSFAHRGYYGEVSWHPWHTIEWRAANTTDWKILKENPVLPEPHLLARALAEGIHPWYLPRALNPGDQVKHLDGSNGEVLDKEAAPDHIWVLWRIPYPRSSLEFFYCTTEVQADTLTLVEDPCNS